MRVLTLVYLILTTSSLYADIMDDIERELRFISKYCQEVEGSLELETHNGFVRCVDGRKYAVTKEDKKAFEQNKEAVKVKTFEGNPLLKKIDRSKVYQCKFENGFLVARCNKKKYFFNESLSSIKSDKIDSFYNFVRKSESSEIVKSKCYPLKMQSEETYLFCDDFELVYESSSMI